MKRTYQPTRSQAPSRFPVAHGNRAAAVARARAGKGPFAPVCLIFG